MFLTKGKDKVFSTYLILSAIGGLARDYIRVARIIYT